MRKVSLRPAAQFEGGCYLLPSAVKSRLCGLVPATSLMAHTLAPNNRQIIKQALSNLHHVYGLVPAAVGNAAAEGPETRGSEPAQEKLSCAASLQEVSLDLPSMLAASGKQQVSNQSFALMSECHRYDTC